MANPQISQLFCQSFRKLFHFIWRLKSFNYWRYLRSFRFYGLGLLCFLLKEFQS